MGSFGDQLVDEPPKIGLKLPLNHVYTLESNQFVMPTAKQICHFIPLVSRYMEYYIGRRMHNKKPVMDWFNMAHAEKKYGCPIGGIGGGTIGRGFKGEFCRFQLYPGIYNYVTVPECQFIVNIKDANKNTIFQSVLSTYSKPKKAPASWQWNLDPTGCEYTGLYPRAWTTYDLTKYGIKLVCRQISPVIPHNYKDSSLPCAVFVFTATNVSGEHRDVSITFTWTEVLGASNNKKSIAKLDLERYSEEHTCGVTLEQRVNDTPCTFTIAKRKQPSETIHDGYCLWNARKTSAYVWDCIDKHGRVQPDAGVAQPAAKGADKADKSKIDENARKAYKCDSIALSSVISLEPGRSGSTEFCLAWDMPVIKYDKGKVVYKRYYTRLFGSDGIAGAGIAAYALQHYPGWEKQIADWQEPILSNSNIPDWLKGALMNELYFVADGGTVWFDARDLYPATDPRHDYGLFGYLEGHEYRMYNTYDVHFYASFALAQLWPNLQVVLQYMFRDTIPMETDKRRRTLHDGKSTRYKVKDSVPHDLGEPEGVPFHHINAYNVYDVSEWRDLGLKFVLQVARDHRLLRAHGAPLARERYRAMPYIDDVPPGAEDDLYTRSTGQSEAGAEGAAGGGPAAEGEPGAGTGPGAPPRAVGDILGLLYRNSDDAEESGARPPREPAAGAGAGGGAGGGAAGATAGVWSAQQYLADMYPACLALVRGAQRWDRDGDGLIENGGFPDQTYDAWVMTGPSAYCGGLWIAALSAVCSMALAQGLEPDEREFSEILSKARRVYEERLWTGAHYSFDARARNKHVVMADQLAGHWYLRASGIGAGVFPADKVRVALRTVYECNVLRFRGGRAGAVNGYAAPAAAAAAAAAPGRGDRGRVDRSAIQSHEAWVGVTYALAALMIHEGMYEEAFATAGGLYETLTDMGFAYETPEALYENGNHRSIGYSRPLAIWAMYQAIVARPPPPAVAANGGEPKL